MALYSIAQRSTVTTSGQAAADIACSTGINPAIREWGLFLGAATASRYSLRRTSALGTRTTPVALAPHDPNAPALTGITLVDQAVAFSAEPTELTVMLRTIGLPATIGTGVIWTFPESGLIVATSLSICIINDATNSAALDQYVTADI